MKTKTRLHLELAWLLIVIAGLVAGAVIRFSL